MVKDKKESKKEVDLLDKVVISALIILVFIIIAVLLIRSNERNSDFDYVPTDLGGQPFTEEEFNLIDENIALEKEVKALKEENQDLLNGCKNLDSALKNMVVVVE